MTKVKLQIIEGDTRNLVAFRRLWDEIFDDPKAFADYYFSSVCQKNILLGAYCDNALIGMVHANPYQVTDTKTNRVYDSYYIVGVAVKEAYRRQGIMRQMMQKMLSHLAGKGCPFVFLMPENEKYYESLGFTYIYKTRTYTYHLPDTEKYEAGDAKKTRYQRLSKLEEEKWQALAEEINDWLSRYYRYYAKRSAAYLKSMLLEHQCHGGDVIILYEEDEIIAVFAYAYDDFLFYVERLELCNEKYKERVFRLLFDLARLKQKEKCYITVAENVTSKSAVDTKEKGDAVLLEEANGHGIMAVSLDESEVLIRDMKNNSFFDEIV